MVYHWWRRLQENYRPIYRKISQYHSANSAEILENYLLALFSSVSGPELNGEEIQIVVSLKKNISFYCAEQIASGLEAIISHNTDLEKIPLPDYEESFDVVDSIPDAEELIALHTAFVDSLSRRYPMVGCDGELAHRFSFFEAFALKLAQEQFSVRDYFQDVPLLITNLEFLDNLDRILWMLPQDSWFDFFACNNRKFTWLLSRNAHPIEMLLRWILKIPSASWGVFFEAISSVGVLRMYFNAITVSYFFEYCPEGRWKILHKAMLPLLSNIFEGKEDFISFFRSLQSSLHFKEIAALFSSEITSYFSAETPESLLIDTFLSFEKEMWSMLALVLKSIFFEKMTTFKQILFMTGRIKELSHRVDFLKYAMRYATAVSVDSMSLFALLQMVNESEWKTVFQLIGKKHLNTFIVDHLTLLAFLSMFSNSETRFSCARAIQPNIFLHREINSAELFVVLNKFPECNNALIMIYRHQLIRVLDELLNTLITLNQNEIELPVKIKNVFCFLAEKILPVILDYAYFFSPFPSVGLGELTDAQTQLMIDFKEIEEKHALLDACHKKLKVLELFCRENPLDIRFHSGLTLKFFDALLQQWPLLVLNKSEKIMRDQAVQVGGHPAISVVASSSVRSRVWSEDVLRAREVSTTSQAGVYRPGTNAYALSYQNVELERYAVRGNSDPVFPARTVQASPSVSPVRLFSLRSNPATRDGELPAARRLR